MTAAKITIGVMAPGSCIEPDLAEIGSRYGLPDAFADCHKTLSGAAADADIGLCLSVSDSALAVATDAQLKAME